MKHIITALCLAILFSGCAWKKDVVRNAQHLQRLEEKQDKILRHLKKLTKTTEVNNKNTMVNHKSVKSFFKLLKQNPHLRLKEMRYRQGVKAEMKEIFFRNLTVGKAIYGDAYAAFIGIRHFELHNHPLASPQDALVYLNKGIKILRKKIKAGTASCNLANCRITLIFATFYRASIHAIKGDKKKARADLEWLDRTNNLHHFVTKKTQFWNDKAFTKVEKELWYKRLVAKYKAWFNSQNSSNP